MLLRILKKLYTCTDFKAFMENKNIFLENVLLHVYCWLIPLDKLLSQTDF